MSTLPSLRQLQFLVALSEELHFGRAAEKCFVTQSTLSAGLKELEGVLGAALAERTKRSVIMTAVGQEIADRARLVLRDVEALVDLAAANGEELSGDVRLGAIPTVGPYILPRLMPMLRRRYRGLRLLLREELTDSLLRGLNEGRLDAVIVALPYEIGDIAYSELFVDDYQLACPPDHPLARLDHVDGPALAGARLLLLERGHCLQRHALSAFDAVELFEDMEFAATSLLTLIAMVAEGVGVTLLPQLAIDAGVAEGHDIALVPVRGAYPRRVALAWRRTSSRHEAFEALAAAIRDAARRPAPASAA